MAESLDRFEDKLNTLEKLTQKLSNQTSTLTQSYNKLGNSIGSVKSTIESATNKLSTYYESLYKTSRGLQTLNISFQEYKSTLDKLHQTTNLSTLDAQKLFDTIENGYIGIRDTKALGDFVAQVQNIGKSASETQNMLSVAATAQKKYVDIYDRLKKGESLKLFEIQGLGPENAKQLQEIAMAAHGALEAPEEATSFITSLQNIKKAAEDLTIVFEKSFVPIIKSLTPALTTIGNILQTVFSSSFGKIISSVMLATSLFASFRISKEKLASLLKTESSLFQQGSKDVDSHKKSIDAEIISEDKKAKSAKALTSAITDENKAMNTSGGPGSGGGDGTGRATKDAEVLLEAKQNVQDKNSNIFKKFRDAGKIGGNKAQWSMLKQAGGKLLSSPLGGMGIAIAGSFATDYYEKNKADIIKGGAKSAMTGLAGVGGSIAQYGGMGAMAGPWGALIGGVIGAGVGFWNLKKDLEQAKLGNAVKDAAQAFKRTNDNLNKEVSAITKRGGSTVEISKAIKDSKTAQANILWKQLKQAEKTGNQERIKALREQHRLTAGEANASDITAKSTWSQQYEVLKADLEKVQQNIQGAADSARQMATAVRDTYFNAEEAAKSFAKEREFIKAGIDARKALENQLANEIEKRKEALKTVHDEKERAEELLDIRSKERELLQLKNQDMQDGVKMMESQIEQSYAGVKVEKQKADIATDLAESEEQLSNVQRLGMGANYQAIRNTTEARRKQAAIAQDAWRIAEKNYQTEKSQGADQDRLNFLRAEADKKHSEANKAQISYLEKQNQLRESYINALEEMSLGGLDVTINPTQTSGGLYWQTPENKAIAGAGSFMLGSAGAGFGGSQISGYLSNNGGWYTGQGLTGNPAGNPKYPQSSELPIGMAAPASMASAAAPYGGTTFGLGLMGQTMTHRVEGTCRVEMVDPAGHKTVTTVPLQKT